ncbi:hypothetical protein RR42_m3611 [Cupriavidus basilensis]|uniref:Uncharacterized protein n=1 Tax=Cupriavidus basilensis TaxID=68895 RepID=A0A0C4Y6B3_9BURK|nr:hypothetical protein RR42_m3611 [Cupriavidus basilensis]
MAGDGPQAAQGSAGGMGGACGGGCGGGGAAAMRAGKLAMMPVPSVAPASPVVAG